MSIEIIVFAGGVLATFISLMTVILFLRHKAKNKVLIVDDNEEFRQILGEFLKKRNYRVYTAENREQAKKIIQNEKMDYAIIDLAFADSSKKDKEKLEGIAILNDLKLRQPSAKPIILSGYPFVETKESFKEELKTEIEPEKLLKEIEEIYVFKGDPKKNYILEVLNKLSV